MNSPAQRSFLRRLFGSIGRRPGTVPRAAVRRARPALCLCPAPMSARGEVAGARIAREALAAYQELDDAALGIYFDLLVKEFPPDPEAVGRVADAYRQDPSQANLILLQQVIEPPRQEMFRRLNMATGGTGVIVEMRRRLLKLLPERPYYAGIDAD